MPKIGTRSPSGFSGHLRTLCFDMHLVLVDAPAQHSPNPPDFRIHLNDENGPEVGVAWKRTSEAGDYISILIDDPLFPRPIRARLLRPADGGTEWTLYWIRFGKRHRKA